MIEAVSPEVVAGSELHALQRADGAVFGEVAGHSVARHYGDPQTEYQAAREGCAVAVRADRALVRLWGKDPVRMIQGLITNDLQRSPPGQGVYAAMLTPKGRTLAELRAFRRERAEGVDVLLDLPREALEGTREHLRRMVPPMFARWAVDEGLEVIGVYGPQAPARIHEVLGTAVPEREDAHLEAEFQGTAVTVAATRYLGQQPGYYLYVPAAAAAALWSALREAGARPLGHGAVETLRIEAGRPRFGADLSEDIIPTEAFEAAGLMERAISFNKGCYTGQEVIVRIAHRGHVNRNLRGLRLGDGPAPAAGTRLLNPETGKDVGFLTSVAWSPLRQETIALGYVRREFGPGARLGVGGMDGATATVTELPFAPRNP
jgi:folate-binding protein YgfZ